jgi:hypothetical protein
MAPALFFFMLLFFFLYNNKLIEIFQAITSYLGFIFFEFAVLLS